MTANATTRAHFSWKCKHRGTLWFECADDLGRYELQLRHDPETFEGGNWNSAHYTREIYERDIVGSVNLLVSKGPERIRKETVDAFNIWRLAKHNKDMATIDANPARYGVFAPDDSIRTPPAIVRGGYWQDGWRTVD